MENEQAIPQFISLEKIPSQSLNLVLDEHEINLEFICSNGYTYNWLTVDNEIINAGVLCNSNVRLNQRKLKLFPGSFFFINNMKDNTQPYYEYFDTKFKFVFLNKEQTENLIGLL